MNNPNHPNNIRNQQIEATLQKAICKVIDSLTDPRILDCLITVTQLEISDDRRNMTVYITAKPSDGQARAIHALRNATKHIHAKVSKDVDLRRIPHLYFKEDVLFNKQQDLLTTINEALEFENDRHKAKHDAIVEQEEDQANPENTDSAPETTPEQNEDDA